MRPDAWPHTRRPLPWLLAGFVALLFLIPIDSTTVRVHLPVDSHIDRFALVVLVIAWLWFGGDELTFADRRRSKLFASAAALFCGLAIASVLADGSTIVTLGQLTLAEKHLASLAGFAVVGWLALTALRREDLPGITRYLTGLACLTAVGVLVERQTGYNAFYVLGATLLHPVASVAASPTVIHPALGSDGRVTVVGPTLHGLAVTAMLCSVMPFPLVWMLDARRTRRRIAWALVFGLLVTAAMATDRKTAVIVPLAIVLYLTWYRPRQLLKLLPFGIAALIAIVHVASPGSLGAIFDSNNKDSSSTLHRMADFSGAVPDLLAHPALGRGFGTIEVDKPTMYRINDDEYVDELDEIGIIGLLVYVGMILAPAVAARRAIRHGADGELRSLALAASAGCVGYLVVNALFDAMSFPQAPYAFFVVAGIATVAAREPETSPAPAMIASPGSVAAGGPVASGAAGAAPGVVPGVAPAPSGERPPLPVPAIERAPATV